MAADSGRCILITVQTEYVDHLLKTGLVELGYEQWKIGNFQIEHPKEYGPDWDAYRQMESNNRLRFIAMREDDKLIGYISIVFDTDIHNKELLIADIRDIYVDQKKKGYTVRLINYAKKALKEFGVSLFKTTHRLDGADPSAFYAAIGFKPIETVYGMRL